MKRKWLMLVALVAVGACSRAPGSDPNALAGNSGAMVNRADDAPGNAATAPVPMSGAGTVPPSVANQASGAMNGDDQADNRMIAP